MSPGLLEHPRLGEQLVEPRGVVHGSIEQIHELIPMGLIEREGRSVSEFALGLPEGCLDNEVGQVLVSDRSRLTHELVCVWCDA
jgi:hypothetical protein